ncbi:hypothetical protein [Lachnoclostridium phytofermentans]|nr:hypothetical protein [Lachnoclostridium phytofermentans]
MEECRLTMKSCCQERFSPVIAEINRILISKQATILVAIDG